MIDNANQIYLLYMVDVYFKICVRKVQYQFCWDFGEIHAIALFNHGNILLRVYWYIFIVWKPFQGAAVWEEKVL